MKRKRSEKIGDSNRRAILNLTESTVDLRSGLFIRGNATVDIDERLQILDGAANG